MFNTAKEQFGCEASFASAIPPKDNFNGIVAQSKIKTNRTVFVFFSLAVRT